MSAIAGRIPGIFRSRRIGWLAAIALAASGILAAGADGTNHPSTWIFRGFVVFALACFVAWRAAGGRAGRVFLGLGVLFLLSPLLVLILWVVLLAAQGGGCVYGYYEPGQCR